MLTAKRDIRFDIQEIRELAEKLGADVHYNSEHQEWQWDSGYSIKLRFSDTYFSVFIAWLGDEKSGDPEYVSLFREMLCFVSKNWDVEAKQAYGIISLETDFSYFPDIPGLVY